MTRPVPSASDKLAESADGTVGMGGTLGVDSTIEIATTRKENYWVDLGLRSVSIIGFFALWYAASLINAHVWRVFNPALLPTPADVLEAAIQLTYSGELPRDVAASLGRVVMGFLIAAFLGVSLGTLIGRSRNMERLLEPALELLRPIPPLAFLPMFVLWFGIGGVFESRLHHLFGVLPDLHDHDRRDKVRRYSPHPGGTDTRRIRAGDIPHGRAAGGDALDHHGAARRLCSMPVRHRGGGIHRRGFLGSDI